MGRFEMGSDDFERLFGDLSYLSFPLHPLNDSGADDFLHRTNHRFYMSGNGLARRRHLRELSRLEMVRSCNVRVARHDLGKDQWSSQLRNYGMEGERSCGNRVYHMLTNRGVCGVINSPRFDKVFLDTPYTRTFREVFEPLTSDNFNETFNGAIFLYKGTRMYVRLVNHVQRIKGFNHLTALNTHY